MAMTIDTEEHKDFLDKNMFAILTPVRANGSPVSSVVMFARDSETLIVSTPGKTLKRTLLANNPLANLCVIDKGDPPNFVSMECEVVVETDNVRDQTEPLFKKMREFGYQVPDDPEAFVEKQRRVLLRAKPNAIHAVTRFK